MKKSQASNSLQRYILALSLALASTSLLAKPSPQIIEKITAYHDSGAYDQQIAKVINNAEHYIFQQALINQQKTKKKLAIVLDIDETSLSNYELLAKHRFHTTSKERHQAILAANAPAILPTLSLYTRAQKQGIEVFFVTGRPQSELKETEINLIRAGYKNWAGLYLRPNSYKQKSIIPFKAQTRKEITAQGYTILASIGDQLSDLKGGYAQKVYKLPNPFYQLP